jgi:formylmethanofuran:tetrahydromethanopterin formyltransferase
VSGTSATIVATPGTKITQICNTNGLGGGNLWLNPAGAAAAVNAGPSASAGDGCVVFNGGVTNANGNIVTGICDNGTCSYTVTTGN